MSVFGCFANFAKTIAREESALVHQCFHHPLFNKPADSFFSCTNFHKDIVMESQTNTDIL